MELLTHIIVEVANALGGSFKLVTLAPKTVREITQLPKETQKNGDTNKSTRSSADADNGLDAFSGQSRSITMALFLRYSMSKNVVTLKSGSEVTQGH